MPAGQRAVVADIVDAAGVDRALFAGRDARRQPVDISDKADAARKVATRADRDDGEIGGIARSALRACSSPSTASLTVPSPPAAITSSAPSMASWRARSQASPGPLVSLTSSDPSCTRQHVLDVGPAPAHPAAARDGIDDHSDSHAPALHDLMPYGQREVLCVLPQDALRTIRPDERRRLRRMPASARRDTDQRLRIFRQAGLRIVEVGARIGDLVADARSPMWRSAASGSISVLPSSVSA